MITGLLSLLSLVAAVLLLPFVAFAVAVLFGLAAGLWPLLVIVAIGVVAAAVGDSH